MRRTAGLDQLYPPYVARKPTSYERPFKSKREKSPLEKQVTKLRNAISRAKHSQPSLPVIRLREIE